MRVPLHLDPADYSMQTCRVRLQHGIDMAALNPKGFRKAPNGRHKKRPEGEVNRIDFLQNMARLARGAEVMDSIGGGQ